MGFNLIESIETLPAQDARNRLRSRLDAYQDRVPRASTIAPHTPVVEGNITSDMTRRVDPVVIAAEDFNAEVLQRAVSGGCGLIVRNLLKPDVCAQLRLVVDRVLETRQLGDGLSVYRNCPENLGTILGQQKLNNSRGFHAASGSVMCVESAGVCEGLLGLYEDLGLPPILRQFFGDDYCLSALKWVLRRSKLPVSPFGWHQDGAFMGSDIRSVNMWMSLSDCGADSAAPGLDIVARNLKSVVKAGDAGAAFNWSFDSAGMDNLFGPDAVSSPRFGEGDVYFFDHFMLHRTQYNPSQTQVRYALETWFFDGDCYPSNQVPLAGVKPADLEPWPPC